VVVSEASASRALPETPAIAHMTLPEAAIAELDRDSEPAPAYRVALATRQNQHRRPTLLR